ncbi:MAG: hypothetical protein A2W75_10015 [Nitrospinae bacterium RIFCSPLOWO2_12_39_15]|nr:MAG: hypothetical protein A2W53_08095 [Nitrospinae bacterium RIFCSPHIGHO2_02_39_11]OGV99487.1 MAG: hypothetical protein A3D97_01490 [Nitrospinae bacterium RIFCSPHIGHO2_12_FULL_39_42]OGW10507.1 MAG: hypothetical protein A2W75_10015 [Nitrospinae bacterium RIFCSPLOWO2_12_39_15]
MNCKDFTACMEGFIDGDVEKDIKEKCESHIKECRSCMEKAMNFEKCIEFFKCCMPDAKPPEGMKGWMSRFMAQCCENEKTETKEGKTSTGCCN